LKLNKSNVAKQMIGFLETNRPENLNLFDNKISLNESFKIRLVTTSDFGGWMFNPSIIQCILLIYPDYQKYQSMLSI